jgi:hypothetical protein
MKCWKNCCSSERLQFEAISIAVGGRADLLKVLFDQEQPKLRRPPAQILREALGLCSQDYLLVKLSLDLWCDHGVAVHELLSLDLEVFNRALKALIKLGPSRPDSIPA